MKLSIKILAIIALLSPGLHAHSKEITSFRCGNGLVEVGMSLTSMAESCGNKYLPDEIRTRHEIFESRNEILDFMEAYSYGTRGRHWWAYREYGKFTKWVFISKGRVVKIQEGERN